MLSAGILAWDNTLFVHDIGDTYFGLHDLSSEETVPVSWMKSDTESFTIGSAVDYHPESNQLLAEVRSRVGEEPWLLKVVDLNTGESNLFSEQSGYKFGSPRWVSENSIIYVKIPERGEGFGREIRMLYTKNSSSTRFVSAADVEGATYFSYVDY